MLKQVCLYAVLLLVCLSAQRCWVSSGDAPGERIGSATPNRYNAQAAAAAAAAEASHHAAQQQQQQQQQHSSNSGGSAGNAGNSGATAPAGGSAHAHYHASAPGSGAHLDNRNSYNLLSEAMSQAVSNEFSSLGSGSADGACHADDLDCYSGNIQDRLGMEAIRTLHRQLDDDDNGNIDLSESDDFLREELKYDSGYEKRQKAFHFNDDMHISVKELWEAWLRSEVHNWTIEQTTDWLAQSVQLPQYVELFKLHKVAGAALPRLAVNNMHYVSNVLGIKDPIHKQKIALKAMDVVLFGPPRETGTRWKDYILVTLLLSAIIGCWYAYQQNKNAKRHLRRMAQDMEGLQRAEQSLQEMQKELERARMEQENVATEKMDLERRLKEAPSLSASSSDLEVQQLKKEIEILRSELSRAEIELVDNCWAPPPQLQSWLQYTYELESKNHQKKRVSAEKQLQCAREACEKLRKKRSSLVGAFVSTHGKSIDDVDRSIVEARNSLSEVTNELQERLHRWKQIENCLGFNIANNNGLPYLESVLYGRNGGSLKSSRGRMTSSTDDLDDDSVQGMFDSYSRSSVSVSGGHGGSSGGPMSNHNNSNTMRDDSSCSDDGTDTQSVQFYLGNAPPPPVSPLAMPAIMPARAVPPLPLSASHSPLDSALYNHNHVVPCGNSSAATPSPTTASPAASIASSTALPAPPPLPPHSSAHTNFTNSQMLRSQSTDLVPMEIYTYLGGRPHASKSAAHAGIAGQQLQQSGGGTGIGNTAATGAAAGANATNSHSQSGAGVGVGVGVIGGSSSGGSGVVKKMVKQHSTASQQSTSSTSSSVQSAPAAAGDGSMGKGQSPGRWSSHERVLPVHEHQQFLLHQQQQHQQQQHQQHQQQQHQYHHQPQRQHAADKESLQQSQHAAAAAITAAAATISTTATAAQRMSAALSLQSLCLKPQHGHNDGNGAGGDGGANSSSNHNTTATASAPATAAPHSDAQLQEQLLLAAISGGAAAAAENASLDGSLKKHKRRLRFPFGGSRKKSSAGSSSSKSKLT